MVSFSSFALDRSSQTHPSRPIPRSGRSLPGLQDSFINPVVYHTPTNLAVLGVFAGLASLIIPGYGIVIGSGALATAVGAAVGTTAAGAVAGGATGYLKDMGVNEEHAREYEQIIGKDGAVVSVGVPSKGVSEVQATEILNKYGAFRISSSAHTTV